MINGEHRHDYWGPKGTEWERLPASIEVAAQQYADDFFDPDGAPAEVELIPYHSMEVGLVEIDLHVERALEGILESLDEDHGDPEGAATEPTSGMRAASAELVSVIKADYRSFWSEQCCDETVTVALPPPRVDA